MRYMSLVQSRHPLERVGGQPVVREAARATCSDIAITLGGTLTRSPMPSSGERTRWLLRVGLERAADGLLTA